VRQNITLAPRTGRHFLLPERREIIDIITEIDHMAAMRIFQQATGTPLTAVVDDEHIKAEMEQVIRQLSILHIAFNSTRANHDNPVMSGGMETDKAHRDIIHTGKFCLFSLTPEVG
jgi:hypothetical protein